MDRFRAAIVTIVLVSFVGCSSPTTPSQSTPRTMVVYEVGASGLTLPTLLKEVKPSYTAAAIGNRIQGTVIMTAVALSDGTVGEVIVTQSLDTRYGLDAQAIQAARQWLFNPGIKDGIAVAVRVVIEMTFTLV